jgi:hypothetical protein
MDLLFKFPDQSDSFTRGVEFGRILEQMQRLDGNIDNSGFPVRIENKQVLIDACKVYGYIPTFGNEYYGEWIEFLGIKKTSSNN